MMRNIKEIIYVGVLDKFFLKWHKVDKEDVVHIYNGILLSHKKEQNWVICRDMDGPRVSYRVK